MPILIHKDGWTGERSVLFVGPDKSGEYPVNEGVISLVVPEQIDELFLKEAQGFVDNQSDVSDSSSEVVLLDYSRVDPRNREQILFITGLGLYRTKFYLNGEGRGSALGLRPKPQPRAHEYSIVSFNPIRDPELYRRQHGFTDEIIQGRHVLVPGVIGWEERSAFLARKTEENGHIHSRKEVL